MNEINAMWLLFLRRIVFISLRVTLDQILSFFVKRLQWSHWEDSSVKLKNQVSKMKKILNPERKISYHPHLLISLMVDWQFPANLHAIIFPHSQTITTIVFLLLVKPEPVSNEDLLEALKTTKPSSFIKTSSYEKWSKEHGSVWK